MVLFQDEFLLKNTTNQILKIYFDWIILYKERDVFMNFKKIKNLVTAALFASIICAATFVVKIPSPATNGYFNLGDCFVILAGFLLGPVYGALAAGVGSALADIIAGYVQYAPATFVIKAVMALSVCLIIRLFKNKNNLLAKILSGITAEAIMVLGYFAYEAAILGYGLSAAGSIISNILQGLVGIVASTVIISAIGKSKTLTDFFRKG